MNQKRMIDKLWRNSIKDISSVLIKGKEIDRMSEVVNELLESHASEQAYAVVATLAAALS